MQRIQAQIYSKDENTEHHGIRYRPQYRRRTHKYDNTRMLCLVTDPQHSKEHRYSTAKRPAGA